MTATLDPPAVRARSEAQREAARRNGARSRGPSTPGGKANSRRNALRHGHRAEVVMPPDLEAEATRMIVVMEEAYAPRDDFERTLVAQASAALARVARLDRAELHRTAERVRTAIDRWDADRDAEIRALADRLETDPDPEPALIGLRGTCEGCDYLADSWDALLEAFEARGAWTPDEADRVWLLAGTDRVADRLLDLAERAPNEPEALAHLKAEIDALRAELVERGNRMWEQYDRPARQSAPTLAYFDPSPEGRLLFRYRVEADRVHRRALAELRRHRREAPNEPEPPSSPRPPAAGPPPARSPEPPVHLADSSASRAISTPRPNEPEPAAVRDPAARKRRPDPKALLRRARR